MHLITHTIINVLIVIALSIPLANAVIVVAAGILIDLDHPLYYIFSGKAKGILHSFKLGAEHVNAKHPYLYQKPEFFIFHTFEFLLLLVLLSFYIPILKFVVLGWTLHLIEDAAAYFKHYRNFKWLRHWFLLDYIK